MKQQGFTLIELMIAVVIVGILAAIAYPSYTEYVLKSNRAEGKAHLLEAMQAQERHYSQTMSYQDDITKLVGVSVASTTNKYRLSIEKCTGAADVKRCVLLQVTPERADPDCAILSLDSRGAKAATGTRKNDNYCW